MNRKLEKIIIVNLRRVLFLHDKHIFRRSYHVAKDLFGGRTASILVY